MEQIVLAIEEKVWGIPLVLLLLFTHIFFSFRLKFPQKGIFKGLKIIFQSDSHGKNKISSFKSLMTVLAATLGTGNIIGISTAITIGGIGSIFWVFISGVFAVSTKYAETYLVLKYRKKEKGKYYGGAMYVLKDRLHFKVLPYLFSIFIVLSSFGIGAMIQSNSITEVCANTFDISKKVIALIVTLICTYAIFGNEKRIANVSSILVPLATIIYMYMCIYILNEYRYNILDSIKKIVVCGINFKSAVGGITGALVIKAMNAGISKGLFSNEAGMGSSPVFNATVEKVNIKDESTVASTSVFIDTVILCTLTGIVIVSTGLNNIFSNPVELVNEVFSLVPYGKYLLSFSIAIFAIATIPCWWYYGSIGIKYIFKNSSVYEKMYKYIYIACIIIGSFLTVTVVWSISSITNALMIIPNVIMIYLLQKEIE